MFSEEYLIEIHFHVFLGRRRYATPSLWRATTSPRSGTPSSSPASASPPSPPCSPSTTDESYEVNIQGWRIPLVSIRCLIDRRRYYAGGACSPKSRIICDVVHNWHFLTLTSRNQHFSTQQMKILKIWAPTTQQRSLYAFPKSEPLTFYLLLNLNPTFMMWTIISFRYMNLSTVGFADDVWTNTFIFSLLSPEHGF